MITRCCAESDYTMTSAQNVMLRAAIVLGMVAAVVTILYFTPMPDYNFKSCDRQCHDLDWPLICRVKLNLEMPHLRNREYCEKCRNYNLSDCAIDSCPKIDDLFAGAILTNHHLPGPSIHVCQNDILVIDVVNKVPGYSFSLHWRGQPNDETPFMDGVPMVTQCPISTYTTFQYKFRASSPGTHYYHSHSDGDRSGGLFGALVVRQPEKIEPHKKMYDADDKTHVILISEAADKRLLLNGRGGQSGGRLTALNVTKGKRYRFRIAYAAGYSGCPVVISIDEHLIKVIALDGSPVSAYEAGSIELNKGERVDFVLKTNRDVDDYFLRAETKCPGEVIDGLAVINYEGSSTPPSKESDESQHVESNSRKTPEKKRTFDTTFCEGKIGKVCLGDVKSISKIPEMLGNNETDRVVFLNFDFRLINHEGGFSSKVYGINNLTFVYPSSPLLTQLRNVPLHSVCDELNVPEKCMGKNICECVHVEYIPLGSSVELILINQGEAEEHVLHLHGHQFYPVGYKIFETVPSLPDIKIQHENDELFKRNLNSPAAKDTIRVPKKSLVAVRFHANNPGFWMLRDENSKGWSRGLDMVFQVGDLSEMISAPANFPACGDYIGPDFFLI